MTWVVVGFAVAIGVTVAAMFLLTGRRQPRASITFPHEPNSGCNGCRIVVTLAAPDRDVWMPENWLG